MTRSEYFEKWGMESHFNKFPSENVNFISHKEFSNHTMFWTYSPEFTETRQIKIKDEKRNRTTFKSVKFFYFFDGTYLGMFRDWVNGCEFTARYLSGKACEHVFRAPTKEERKKYNIPHPRMSLHVSICDKCSYVRVIDSSD